MSLEEFGKGHGGAGGAPVVGPKIGDPSMSRADFNSLSRKDQERHVAAITVLPSAAESFPKTTVPRVSADAPKAPTAKAPTAKKAAPLETPGRTGRPELPIHLQSVDDEGNSRNFTPDERTKREAILAQQEEWDKANARTGKLSFGGGRVAGQPREKTPAQKIREGIATKISAARARMLGSKEEESEPVEGSAKTSDLISHIRNLAAKVDAYHSELPGKVEAEAKYHEGEADKYGIHTPEGQEHAAHAGRLRAALGLHLQGLRQVRDSNKNLITRPDMTASGVVAATSRVAGAEETAQGSGDAVNATGVANTHGAAAAKKLHSTIKGIARTPLGKLGFLPDITKQDLDQLTANAETVQKPSVNYDDADRNTHPVTGEPSKRGHVWVGTAGGLRPTIRQVPVHPDTLKEILGTLRNGRKRTKQDPDYRTVSDALKSAARASGGSGKGVYKGADAAGLPVKMVRTPMFYETTDAEGKTVQTPVAAKDIPEGRRVKDAEGKDMDGVSYRPTLGAPHNRSVDRRTVQENRRKALEALAAKKAATRSAIEAPSYPTGPTAREVNAKKSAAAAKKAAAAAKKAAPENEGK